MKLFTYSAENNSPDVSLHVAVRSTDPQWNPLPSKHEFIHTRATAAEELWETCPWT